MKRPNISVLGAMALAGLLSLQPSVRAADAVVGTNGVTGVRGERMREHMAKVASELGLTDEQKAKLKPIFAAEGAKMKALRDDASLSREQKREKFRTIREEIAAQVKPILTAEQLAKWQAMRAARRSQGQQPGAGK